MHAIIRISFIAAITVGLTTVETVAGAQPGTVRDHDRRVRQDARIRAQAAIDAVHDALAEAVPPQTLRQIVTDMREKMLPPPAVDPRAQALASEDVEEAIPDENEAVRPISRLRNVAPAVIRETRLPRLHVQQLRAEDAHRAVSGQKTRRIGIGRAVHVEMNDGDWTQVGNEGWLWSADVIAEEAVGVRLHFSKIALAEGANLVVYAPDETVVAGPYLGAGPLGEGEFWTPTIFGERARVEYFVPANHDGGDPHNRNRRAFIIDDVQHLYVDPFKAGSDDGVGNCHNDIKCFAGWPSTGKAVGRIAYIENSSSFVCSGQLMNSLNGDFTPYFLTARHCIDSNTVANTAEIFWKYQTSVCDGPPPSLFSVPTSNICTLLHTGASSDFTLLMVEGKLPKGLTWAGWIADAAVNGTAVACIHHPGGSYKRISFGNKAANPQCGTDSGFLRVDWSDGPTEPGSSGAGAFRTDTRQLIGILSCGSSACGNRTNDSYGAFSAFYSAIASFLEGGSDDWLEDNDWCSAAKVITPGTYNDLVVKQVDADWYRVFVPAGKRITVTVSFTNTNGNINLNLHRLCNADPVAEARGGGNVELVTYVNPEGGTYYRFRVNVANDPRNTYSMVVAITNP
jgi:hypothetical protein